MVVFKAKVIDSTHLELSKPIDAPGGGTVFVSVAEPGEEKGERSQWWAASARTLMSAYGKSEPDYTASMIRESNKDYVP